MSILNNITATRTSAGPFLLRVVVLRTVTALAPVMLLWLAARRLFGNFAPLPGAALTLLGLAAVGSAILWRHVWRLVEGRGAWRAPFEHYVPAVCMALLAVALSVRGTHPIALVFFWLTLIAEEVWYGWRASPLAQVERPHPGPLPRGEGEVNEEAALLQPGVSQHITRTADVNGETLDCLLRVIFAVGEQTQAVHVAFCPPLCFTPTATGEPLDGAACEVKVTAIETFGARLEVKRRGALVMQDEAIVLLRVVGPAVPANGISETL